MGDSYGGPSDRASRGATAPASSRSEAARAAEAGAPSPSALLAAAQGALATDDFEALLACVWPETRDVWLADLVVDLAVESTDRGDEVDMKKRNARAEVRAILSAYGATVSKRPDGLTPGVLGKSLLERVPDRVRLYADLLRFAARERAPFDPARALTGSKEPSSSAVPLVRLVDRIKPPAALETNDGGVIEVPEEGSSAVFLVSGGAPAVLRLRAKGGAYWLDES